MAATRTKSKASLHDAVKEFVKLRRKRDDLSQQYEDTQEATIGLFEGQGVETVLVDVDESTRVQATVVGGTLLDIDEVKLRKRLGAKVYDGLCTSKLDRSKLEDAVARGEVDPVAVAACSTERPKKKFIKLTFKK